MCEGVEADKVPWRPLACCANIKIWIIDPAESPHTRPLQIWAFAYMQNTFYTLCYHAQYNLLAQNYQYFKKIQPHLYLWEGSLVTFRFSHSFAFTTQLEGLRCQIDSGVKLTPVSNCPPILLDTRSFFFLFLKAVTWFPKINSMLNLLTVCCSVAAAPNSGSVSIIVC